MKSVTDVLHRTPWWGLLLGGLAVVLALAVFVTPYALIDLSKSGATPEENRAIKREMDLTFSEGAVDIARGIVREMRDHARDPARREELEHALEEIERARESLREAGAEVMRAKREAGEDVAGAVREASRAMDEAQREAQQALRSADQEIAKDARAQALAAREEARAARQKAREAARIAREKARAEGKPASSRITIMTPGMDKPLVNIDIDRKGGVQIGPEGPPLPPEVRAQIRRKVTDDLWRIGVGAGLILIFIPLFIITVIAKFFTDRSRAAQRLAALTRKEAEYHRMSQQVTEAKLSALQAQVEPHFLYNTLAHVVSLVDHEPKIAKRMVERLITLLRATASAATGAATLGGQVELLRAYLDILELRMGSRLAWRIDVPPDLAALRMPPMLLQPLVENAVKHGLEPDVDGGALTVTARRSGTRLELEVTDTGRGLGSTVDGVTSGLGLVNLRARLAALYGDAARLTIEENAPRGTCATIALPLAAFEVDATAATVAA